MQQVNKVLDLIISGKTNAQIAQELNIKVPTVKYHITNLLRQNRVCNRAQLIAMHSMPVVIGNTLVKDLKMMQADLSRIHEEKAKELATNFKSKEQVEAAFNHMLTSMRILPESNVAINMRNYFMNALYSQTTKKDT